MKPLVAAIAVLVALAVGAQAQTPLIDALRARAEQGDAVAQNALGFRYSTGLGVPQDDAEAVRWWRPAADQGYPEAQYNLGAMYITGRGVPQDDAEAMRWWRLAAEQGYAAAQFNLGVMYGEGRGVPQDYVQAHMWLNLAASRLTGERQETVARDRDNLADRMTPEDRSEAQRRVREWQAAHSREP